MADLAANTTHKTRPRGGRDSFQIANGVTLYSGALVSLEGGYLNHWADGSDDVFMGVLLGGDLNTSNAIVGDTSATPVPEAWVDTSGATLMHLDSVGDTPSQAKVGDDVYCSTSNTDDITLSATGANYPIGYLSKFRSTTDVDVTLYTPAEARAKGRAVHELPFQLDLADIADGDLVTDYTVGYSFEIVETYFITTEAVTTASRTTTLSLDIGATAVTNSDVVVTSAAATPAGTIINNAGALAANTGSATDTLTLKAASTTAHAEGKGIYMVRIRAL